MSYYAHNVLSWIIFNAAILGIVGLDLGIFQRKPHTPSCAEALVWSVVWVTLAIMFGAWLSFSQGKEWALLFFTGYTLEKSLSLDNILVFAVIFQTLKIPSCYQHKILKWGIIGALIMRFLMIWSGVWLLEKFHFLMYFFGSMLILTGCKIIWTKGSKSSLEENSIWRWVQKILPIDHSLNHGKFWIRRGEKVLATPLFVGLILVEFSDLVFAVDSIPAIFAITQDPFIIYTANIFAILGLRSLYFLLNKALENVHSLKKGLSFILIFVGCKMMGLIKISTVNSLMIILIMLSIALLASFFPRKTS